MLEAFDENALLAYAERLSLYLARSPRGTNYQYRLCKQARWPVDMHVPTLFTRGWRHPFGTDRLPECPLAIFFIRSENAWRAEIRDDGTLIYLGWSVFSVLMVILVGVAWFQAPPRISQAAKFGAVFILLAIFAAPVIFWFRRRKREIVQLEQILEDFVQQRK